MTKTAIKTIKTSLKNTTEKLGEVNILNIFCNALNKTFNTFSKYVREKISK